MFTKIFRSPSSLDEFLLIKIAIGFTFGGGIFLILVSLFLIFNMLIFEKHNLKMLTFVVEMMWAIVMLISYCSFGFVLATIPLRYFASKFIRPTHGLILFAVFVNLFFWFLMKDYLQFLKPQNNKDSDISSIFFAVGLGVLSIFALALLIGVTYSYIIFDPNRSITQKINKDFV